MQKIEKSLISACGQYYLYDCYLFNRIYPSKLSCFLQFCDEV